MADDGQISALERLARLRDSGNLTEEEYEKGKAKVLASKAEALLYRRFWFVVLLTVLVATFPIALVILLTGPVYRKVDGARVPVQNGIRYAYVSALGVWLVAVLIDVASGPSVSQRWKETTNPAAASTSDATSGTDNAKQDVADTNGREAPEACDGSDAADEVKNAVENGAASKLVQVKVEDFGHTKELMFDKENSTRYCQADVVLNTGETAISYKFFFGPSGSAMIEVRQGADAFGTAAMSFKAKMQTTAGVDEYGHPLTPTKPVTSDASQSATPQPADQSSPNRSGNIPAIGSIAMEQQYSTAYNQCIKDHGGDDISQSDSASCLEGELNFQVGKLNSTYKSLLLQLDPASQAQLREKQRIWIKSLQTECSDKGSMADMGSAAELAQPGCELDTTIQRRLHLEQMHANSHIN